MSIYEFENNIPSIMKGTFIFPSADIIGNVTIGKNCYIESGARIRGDYGSIQIGDDNAIEENVVIHARPNEKNVIRNSVTIGHAAIIHNSKINDWVVIGVGAIVCDYAEIGEWDVIAEGAMVKNKAKISDKSITVGIPAKIVAEINSDYQKQWTEYKKFILIWPEKDFQNLLK